MQSFWDSVLNLLNDIYQSLLDVLPDSPFQFNFSDDFNEILGYINYFIPFSWIANTLLVWLGCVLSYYLVSVVMRWAKMIS